MARQKKKALYVERKICASCGQPKNIAHFYKSNSIMFVDGKVPICKDCFKEKALKDDGSINIDNFKDLMRTCDKPLFLDILENVHIDYKKNNPHIDPNEIQFHGKEILSSYIKRTCIAKYNKLNFADSERCNFLSESVDLYIYKKEQTSPSKEEEIKQIMGFAVTDEIKDRFGEGYSSSEYKKFQNKYDKLKKSYTINSAMHEEYLVTYVIQKCKAEEFTSLGNASEAKKWNDMASDSAVKAKLTPNQLKKNDLNGGIGSFSEIAKELESQIDIIPILPQFKTTPKDACDFIIWQYVNYIRKLQGLPECDYEDIYKFYDKKVEEYIEQYGDPYGIIETDNTKKIRDSIKQFIQLPNEYGV